jgi:hypothetical protein
MSLEFCVEMPLKRDINDKLSASFLKAKRWRNGDTIKVQFLDEKNIQKATFTPVKLMKKRSEIDPIEYEIRGLSPEEAIKKVIRERIEPICNLRFVFVESGGNVRIGFNAGNGSWSLVGTDCLTSKEEKTMNFAWLDASVIMHEFGHVLGLIHEHSNPRGNTIEWNKEKLYEVMKKTQNWDKKQVDINIIERYKTNQVNGSQFDPESIMLYFFPPSLTLNNQGTDINQKLSQTDVEYINKEYPNDTDPYVFYKKVYGEDKKKGRERWMWFFWPILAGIILGVGIITMRRRKKAV